MKVTWVKGYPSGKEEGTFLVVDMGGTHLRVMQVHISPNDRSLGANIQEDFPLPTRIKTGSAGQLWDFIAGVVGAFIEKRVAPLQKISKGDKIPLALTFSYPVHQLCINRGILQRWTKDFRVSEAVGHEVVAQFQQALEQNVSISLFPCFFFFFFFTLDLFMQKTPVKVVALVNDTTSTLVAVSSQASERMFCCCWWR